MQRIAPTVGLIALVMLTLGSSADAKRPRPLTDADVIGTWRGYSEGQLEFAVLRLDADGKGVIAVSYLPDDPAELYRIDKWAIRRSLVEASVTPIDVSAEPVTLTPMRLGVSALSFQIRGATWTRNLVLFNADAYDARLRAASTRLQSADALSH